MTAVKGIRVIELANNELKVEYPYSGWQMPGVTPRRPFIIAVSGGTASGKSSVCRRIINTLTDDQRRQVALICQDSFYRPLNEEEREEARKGNFNFDHPEAFDIELFRTTIQKLRRGEKTQVPVYDYKQNQRSKEVRDIGVDGYPIDVVIVEGILVLYIDDVRSMYDMKVFVDTDADTRLARRVRRDMQERNRTLDTILRQYENFVKPCYDMYCLPTKKYADIVLPRGEENTGNFRVEFITKARVFKVAIDVIIKHIQEILRSPRASPARTGPKPKLVGGQSPSKVTSMVSSTTAINGTSSTSRQALHIDTNSLPSKIPNSGPMSPGMRPH